MYAPFFELLIRESLDFLCQLRILGPSRRFSYLAGKNYISPSKLIRLLSNGRVCCSKNSGCDPILYRYECRAAERLEN